ncbi:MAG: hypothetical protein GY832_36270 [Chloroflexi bacterium]|nr:hypothetical protein [Chloroflexota bacterium]
MTTAELDQETRDALTRIILRAARRGRKIREAQETAQDSKARDDNEVQHDQ